MAVSSSEMFVMHGAREAMANGMPHIEEQIKSIEQAAVSDKPSLTFDLAKTLVESVCKTILTERAVTFDKDDDLPKLFKAVTIQIPFLPSSATNESDARKSLKQTLGGLYTSLHGVCELRNAYGFASHGSDGPRPAMESVQALLAAQAADAIVGFLHRTHRQSRLIPPGARLKYEDNPDFNEYLDDTNGVTVIVIGEGELADLLDYRPSEVLFSVDYEAYRNALADFRSQQENGAEEEVADNIIREEVIEAEGQG